MLICDAACKPIFGDYFSRAVSFIDCVQMTCELPFRLDENQLFTEYGVKITLQNVVLDIVALIEECEALLPRYGFVHIKLPQKQAINADLFHAINPPSRYTYIPWHSDYPIRRKFHERISSSLVALLKGRSSFSRSVGTVTVPMEVSKYFVYHQLRLCEHYRQINRLSGDNYLQLFLKIVNNTPLSHIELSDLLWEVMSRYSRFSFFKVFWERMARKYLGNVVYFHEWGTGPEILIIDDAANLHGRLQVKRANVYRDNVVIYRIYGKRAK